MRASRSDPEDMGARLWRQLLRMGWSAGGRTSGNGFRFMLLILAAAMVTVTVTVLLVTSLGIPPLDHAGALAMVENLRGVKILRGARGRPAVDLSAVASFLVRLGDVAVALREQVAAIDVNPLFVRETDVLVGDALVIPQPARPERDRTTPAAVPLPSTESDHEQIPEQMAP